VVVVVAVVVVVVLGVDVDVEPVVELVELVELDVELVVESVLLVVVSASTPSGPAKPALAKYPSSASKTSADAAVNVLMSRRFKGTPCSRIHGCCARFDRDRTAYRPLLQNANS
jgi:hypothetical protein